MQKNGTFFATSLKKNNSRLTSSKKVKINNIYTASNKDNNNTNHIDNNNNNNEMKKCLFNKIKNNVLISNTYNFKNENDNAKKNLKNYFIENKNININTFRKEKQIMLKDKFIFKNNDFVNKNKINQKITKSQRIFKFYMPKENSKRDINLNFYRYSGTNIYKNNINYNNNFNNCNINNNNDFNNNNNCNNSNQNDSNNFLSVNKSNSIINRNRMIKSEKHDYIRKDDNTINIVNNFKKLLMHHKTNYFLQQKNAKEIIEKKVRKPNFLIKAGSPPKLTKGKVDQNINKNNFNKKRPLSTRHKSNLSKNINSIDDLLELSQKQNDDTLSNDLTNYVIGKTLGKGAYAIVKIVTNKKTNVKYAAKIYKKSEIRDKIRKRCVNNEIDILKHISHKNIIKLIEVIELKDHLLIIEELFIGISLSQYYNKNWKTEDLSKEKEKAYKIILRQIFEAMNYLHKNNIAHLDIKLENILINKKLEIRIIDFGFGVYDPKKTLNNFFGGTPNYMSPEIVLKRPYISILSDIWSLGVLVFKLFCNDYPFKGFTEKDLYTCITKGKFRIKCYVNFDVRKIINSMLVLEPNKRLSLEQLLKSPWFSNNNNKDK